jgi:hypothetical protein
VKNLNRDRDQKFRRRGIRDGGGNFGAGFVKLRRAAEESNIYFLFPNATVFKKREKFSREIKKQEAAGRTFLLYGGERRWLIGCRRASEL